MIGKLVFSVLIQTTSFDHPFSEHKESLNTHWTLHFRVLSHNDTWQLSSDTKVWNHYCIHISKCCFLRHKSAHQVRPPGLQLHVSPFFPRTPGFSHRDHCAVPRMCPLVESFCAFVHAALSAVNILPTASSPVQLSFIRKAPPPWFQARSRHYLLGNGFPNSR